jgi:hypothetical protein
MSQPRSFLSLCIIWSVGFLLSVNVFFAVGYASPLPSKGDVKVTTQTSHSSLEKMDSKDVLSIDKTNNDVMLGWSMGGLAGFNLCMPSGSATCDQTYPGVNLGLITEYRWRYLGILIDLYWGTLTPRGSGSDHVKYRLGHLGLGGRIYGPRQEGYDYFVGGSLGWGNLALTDVQSESAVEWSSFWSDFRMDLGTTWPYAPSLAFESMLSMAFHFGGTRCILFQGSGPCSPVNELKERERSMARILMFRIGIRWMP